MGGMLIVAGVWNRGDLWELIYCEWVKRGKRDIEKSPSPLKISRFEK